MIMKELEEIEYNCKIAIESLFASVTNSNKAAEHWRIIDLNSSNKDCFGVSAHIVIFGGELKEEAAKLPEITTLKNQLNRSIRKIIELFPNSENETLIWRAIPHINLTNEYEDSHEKLYLRFRLSSMPKNAIFFEEDENKVA